MRQMSVISGHPLSTGFRRLRVVNETPGIGVSHYRYCPIGQRIRVTHHYVRRSTAHLTLIGIPIYP